MCVHAWKMHVGRMGFGGIEHVPRCATESVLNAVERTRMTPDDLKDCSLARQSVNGVVMHGQLMKAKTQEERAHVDLKFHFMKRTLRELVSLCSFHIFLLLWTVPACA